MADRQKPEYPHHVPYGWNVFFRWIGHVIELAHTKTLALLLVFFLGVFAFKLWRGDDGDLAKFEAIMERSDARNQRYNELNFKIVASSLENLGGKVDRNTTAVETNTAQIVKSIAGRTFTTPAKKSNNVPTAPGAQKPPGIDEL